MLTRRTFGAAGFGLAAVAAILLLLLSLVGDGPDSAEDGELSFGAEGSAVGEALTLRYPVRESGVSGDVYFLPLDELLERADFIAIGVVGKQGEYRRLDAGAPGLQGVSATYLLQVERYVKGAGADSLNFRKIIAYEYSGEESFIPEAYAYYIDDPSPLSEGDRYAFALRLREDGWVELVAEPFRFRLQNGKAVAESGMLDKSFLEERFPTKPEADFIAEIEAVVAAQAAETSAR